jgi:hypothetical protein
MLSKLEKLETLRDLFAVTICVLSIASFVLSILLIVVVNNIEKINKKENNKMYRLSSASETITGTESTPLGNLDHQTSFIEQFKAKGHSGCTISHNGNTTWVSFYPPN